MIRLKKHRGIKVFVFIAAILTLLAYGFSRLQPEALKDGASSFVSFISKSVFSSDSGKAVQKTTDNKGGKDKKVYEINAEKGYQYNNLDGGQHYYIKIYNEIKERREPFSVFVKNRSQAIEAFKAVVEDHPEFIEYQGGYSYSYTVIIPGVLSLVKFSPKEELSKIELEKYTSRLEKAVNTVASAAEKEKTDYEKIKYVHDYIVTNTDYEKNGSNGARCHNAYGCLVDKKAVCDGYAAAFKLIMNRIGIPCSNVDGGGHKWNYVVLGGEPYYVDVTWDDPVSVGEKNIGMVYRYFMVTTEDIELGHTIESENPPVCKSDKYDYYKMNGLYIESYDRDEFDRLLQNKLADGRAEFKFSSEVQAKAAIQDLIDNGNIWNLSSVRGKYSSLSWTNGADRFLMVSFK